MLVKAGSVYLSQFPSLISHFSFIFGPFPQNQSLNKNLTLVRAVFIRGSSDGFDPAGTRTRFPSPPAGKTQNKSGLLSGQRCSVQALPAPLPCSFIALLARENSTLFEGITKKKILKSSCSYKSKPRECWGKFGLVREMWRSPQDPNLGFVSQKRLDQRCWALPWLPHGVA